MEDNNQDQRFTAGEPGEASEQWDEEEVEYIQDTGGRQMLFWIGGGILVLVLVLVLFLSSRRGGPAPEVDLSATEEKLSALHAQSTNLEAAVKALGLRLERIEKLQETVVHQQTALTTRLDRINRNKPARTTKSRTPSAKKTPAVKAPKTKPAAVAPRVKTHKVIKGDTLFSISMKYKVSVDTLRRLNKIKKDRIRVGQVLKLSSG